MNYVLGYDCDGATIDEYRILRAIWSNDIEIEDLDADPRQYCAVVGDDDVAYAISVYDWWNRNLIRKRENINEDEEIPIIVKPISEMENYEVGYCCTGELYYEFNRKELKEILNSILNNSHNKKLINTKKVNPIK